MSMRAILIVLLLLGLAVGYCGGLEQAGLCRSIYVISEVASNEKAEPFTAQLQEARQNLDAAST